MILGSILVLWCSHAFAGGSVGFDQAARVISQDSKVERFVREVLDVRQDGIAVRLGPHFKHLGGARVGPYSFEARIKGSKDYTLEITVCTEIHWIDAAGKDAADTFSASSFKEIFKSLVVRSVGASGYASCGENGGT